MAFVEQFIYLVPRHFPVSLQTLYGVCDRLSGAMLLSVGGLFPENKLFPDSRLFPYNKCNKKNNPLVDWEKIRPAAEKVHRTFCEPAFDRRIEAENNNQYHQKRWRTDRISDCRSNNHPLPQVLTEPAGPATGVRPGNAGIPLP